MESIESIKMGLHIGNALKLITDTYPTISKVILELIQNALDSEARDIRVSIDYKTRNISVSDNGCGISPEKFQRAIHQVCSSIKDASKLGQFGIGMMSPLGKCRGFVITSAERSEKHQYHRWVFDSEQILKSSEFPNIPVVPIPGLRFAYAGSHSKKLQFVDWRTEVNINHFTRDRSINRVDLNEIKNLILGQFSEVMRRLNVTITITIKSAKEPKRQTVSFKAADFKGKPLGMVQYGDKEEGKTIFDIYLSPKTKAGRQGEIVVGIEGNDFRIPMHLFLRSVPEIGSEIASVLNSGVFEGKILSNSCTLHPNRKEFVEDESLMNFLIHMESWVRNHGQKYLLAVKEESRDVWLQAVGSLAMDQLEKRLKNQFPRLLEVAKSFRLGTVGPGHYGYKEADHEQSFSSAKTRGKNEKRSLLPKDDSDRQPTPHPGHIPLTVEGKGPKRRLVRGHSSGVQFVFEEMPGNDHHWEFDSNSGVLSFNTRSNIWAKVETSERNLILYQQYCAIKALELQLCPTPSRAQVFEFLQQELRTAIILLTTTQVTPRLSKAEIGRKL